MLSVYLRLHVSHIIQVFFNLSGKNFKSFSTNLSWISSKNNLSQWPKVVLFAREKKTSHSIDLEKNEGIFTCYCIRRVFSISINLMKMWINFIIYHILWTLIALFYCLAAANFKWCFIANSLSESECWVHTIEHSRLDFTSRYTYRIPVRFDSHGRCLSQIFSSMYGSQTKPRA